MSALLAYIRAHAADDAPLIPAGWDKQLEHDRWATIYPLGREARPDVFFMTRLMIRRASFDPDRALFVCVGPSSAIQWIADRIAADGLAFTRTWTTFPQFRDDVQAVAADLRAEFPDERPPSVAGLMLVALHRRIAGFLAENGES